MLNQGHVKAFDSYHVKIVKKGVAKLRLHRPVQACPLTVVDIKNIISCFSKLGKLGLVLNAATLIGYFTLLRQSNLLYSPSNQVPDHTLRGCDVSHDAEGLLVWVRSSKTECSRGAGYAIRLTSIPGSNCCPVTAWRRYRRVTLVGASDPAFLHMDGRPLLGVTLLRAIRTALTWCNHDSPHLVTLHSLRRGGAQACATAGASLEAVRDVGRWKSQSVFMYAPKKVFSEAPQALSSLFGGGPEAPQSWFTPTPDVSHRVTCK